MVAEVRPEYDTEWAAMKAVAAKLGIGTTETLRKWVRQDQIDNGARRPVGVSGCCTGWPVVAAALFLGALPAVAAGLARSRVRQRRSARSR
ncbi:hypothetical protein J7E88_32855 [Streptomyces sp. ISL-10]|nr:hypothetical protein [Streptomyces sp. ISL-10]